MSEDDKAKMEQKIINAAVEDRGKKRLSCSEAFKIAQKFDVKIKLVGQVCDKHGIKVSGCQLGCFK